MKPHLLAFSFFAVAPAAWADVVLCTLSPSEELLSPLLTIYSYQGLVHSAFLEFKTDYGDTIPYLFTCNVNCVSDSVGEDYRYMLGVEPEIRNPEQIILITESKTNDYRNIEIFSVQKCTAR